MIYTIRYTLTHLYVAIAWLRTCRLYAHSEHMLLVAYKLEATLYGISKLLLAYYRLIGRHYDDIGIGVDIHNTMGTPCHAGRGIAVDRFGKQLYGAELGQLLAHNVGIQLIGVDIYILGWKNFCKPVIGLLQLCAPGAEEVDKLLRTFLTAARP